MHVPLRRRQILMPRQLLNGPRRRAPHRQVRTERVSQDVHAWLRRSRARRDAPHQSLHDLLRERLPVRPRTSTRGAAQVPCARAAPPPADASAARTAAVRLSATVTWPFQSDRATRVAASADPRRAHSKRHHLAAPQPRLAAQQHDQVTSTDPISRRLHEPLVLLEVVEARRALRRRSSLIVHGMRSMTPHSTAFFSSTFSTVSTLLTVFGRDRCKRDLQPLHVFGRDRVERLVPERGHQMNAQDASPSPRSRSASADSPARTRRGTAARIPSACISRAPPSCLSGVAACRRRAARALAPPPTACAADLPQTGPFVRSRTTVPSGRRTRMSTSQPPLTYGRIFTLIALLLSATRRSSGRASVVDRRVE